MKRNSVGGIITKATLLLFYNGNICYEGSGNSWYLWRSQDTRWSATSGDPRTCNMASVASATSSSTAKGAVINGLCGISNGQIVTSAPMTALCTTGTASKVAGTSAFTWTCAGSGGGTIASCVAGSGGGCAISAKVGVSDLHDPADVGGNTATVACFLNSLGVNSHLNYTDPVNNNPSGEIMELQYLGINRIRDEVNGTAAFNQVANAGNVFDVLFEDTWGDTAQDLPGWISMLNQFEQSNPKSIDIFEGPNELNAQEVLYHGVSTVGSPATAVAIQKAEYADIKGDSILSNVLVMNNSINLGSSSSAQAQSYMAAEGNMDAEADIGNVHIYSHSSPPQSIILSTQWGIPNARETVPNKPVIISEFGFTTPVDVGEQQAAPLTLFGLADAFKDGVERMYIYNLIDGNTGNGNTEDNFGLFHSDGTPKAAATAIHNMTTILNASNGPNGQNFGATATPSISDLPSSDTVMKLANGQGGYDLMVWNEQGSTGRLTVNFGATYSRVNVYDPVQSATPLQTFSGVSQVSVNPTRNLLIVTTTP